MENKFPAGFLWGSATASYQVEGGIENCDWAIAAKTAPSQEPFVPEAGRACDSYNRYEEDFDIVKSLNQNAHRFSIEWARIEPEEGEFDEKEIEHYRKVLDALRARGLEPFVTLWHFTLPLWLSQIGGFENPKSPEIFARYCEKIVSALGDRAKYWITINEPNVYTSQGYIKGIWPPFSKNIFLYPKIMGRLIMSHNLAYQKIKFSHPNLQIGIAQNMIDFQADWNPINRLLMSFFNFIWNVNFLDKISKFQDFIGVNYYHLRQFGNQFNLSKTEYLDWGIYPEGIYNVISKLKKYGKPIYVTENGLADATDAKRAKFIEEHLLWIHRAIQNGAAVRGYFHWSLLDNFEWAHGFGPKFGLVEVDFDTMERRIRPSAYKYAEICKINSLFE